MYHTSQQRNPVVVVLLDCGMLKFTLSGSCSMKLAWIVETPQHPMGEGWYKLGTHKSNPTCNFLGSPIMALRENRKKYMFHEKMSSYFSHISSFISSGKRMENLGKLMAF